MAVTAAKKREWKTNGDSLTIQKESNEKTGALTEFLSEENFKKLEAIMHNVSVKTGSFLFWEGDEANKLYYIRQGRIKLKKSTLDGKELTLSILKQGDLVGEYGGCGQLVHNFSAEVIEDASLGVINIKDLEGLLCQFGKFAVEFMSWLGLCQRTTQSKFRDLLLYGKQGALASTLIRLSNTFGIAHKDGIRIDIKLTNTEIGELIGMTRESVNRFLNAWKEEGTIQMHNGQITICAIENLRSVCNCPSYPVCPKEICRI